MTFYLQRYGDTTYGNQISIGSVGPAIGTPGNGTIDTLAFHKYNANAPVYIDDIYYDDSGQNLSDPLDSVDTDGDGLADGWELDYFPSLSVAYGETDGTLQSDGDGFTDAQEYAAGTNPLVADTDGDGLNDDVELATYNCSPTQSRHGR